jgi:hypothetical protein
MMSFRPAAPDDPRNSNGPEAPGSAPHEETDDLPSPFPHPPWTVNLVVVAGVITLLFGILVSPIWLVVGSPFVLVLLLWLYVRLFAHR